MALVLHLGVVDIPYSAERREVEAGAKRVKRYLAKGNGKDKAPPTSGENNSDMTTGDVAEILEDKYSVMEYFWEKHGVEVVRAMEEEMAVALQSMLDGFPLPPEPFAEAMGKAQIMFQEFLNTSEMNELLGNGPGTGAARKGVNHRLKHPYAKGNPPRPPFIDTGLFQASFRAWVEGKWSV